MRLFNTLFALVILMQLASCGGGGGGGSNGNTTGAYSGTGSSSTTDISGSTVQDVSACHASASGLANVVPICVDAGPNPSSVGVANEAFVTVQLCVPGSTSQCVVIDHVLVDTGSTGLRVAVEALHSTPLALPAVTAGNGRAVAECYLFVSGWIWGSVNKADVYIGGLVARNVPVHMVGQGSNNPGLGGNAFPNSTACSSQPNVGRDVGSVAGLGANGILGLSNPDHDCDGANCDVVASNNQYFTCASNVCTSTTMATSGQPSHLGLYLNDFADGVIVSMSSLSGTSASSLQGTLSFGIGNIPSTAHQLVLDSQGHFNVSYDGTSYTQAYLDSGSNALYFNSSVHAISRCPSPNNDFYCPSSPLQISAMNSDSNGHNNTVTLTINNFDNVVNATTYVAAGIAGPWSGVGTTPDAVFDWGFPFFIGRTVYVARAGTHGSSYGVDAYTP